jgi:hypothetical protein
MFNKNTFLKVEILPDGKLVFSGKFNKKTNAAAVSDLINSLVTRDHLKEYLHYIYEACKKSGVEEIGEEICERILVFQKDIQVKFISSGRNPIIKPSQVMKQYIGETNE